MPCAIDLSRYHVVRLGGERNPVGPDEQSLFERFGLSPTVVEAERPVDLIRHLENCDGILVVASKLPAEVMHSLTRCRIISRYGIGTDRLDVAAATRHGIIVTNVPTFCNDEMGDHAMALLLAVARQLPRMSKTFLEGAWGKARALSSTNHRLRGQTLGLIGFGNSAKALAVRARSFGMNVVATRQSSRTDPDAVSLGVQMVDLQRLLAQSDYLSLHIPLTEATHHFINADRIGTMKRGAVLINTARGALVDETALAAALKEGHLGGAGLDTFEQIDPLAIVDKPPNHPFLHMDNVVLTPHVAAFSIEAAHDVITGGIDNLVAVLSGKWPPADHIVNRSVVPRFPLDPWDADRTSPADGSPLSKVEAH
jgi:D-3-phosphoglycerate dehydrogenase